MHVRKNTMIRIIIVFVLLTGCSAKFDSFDPATSTLKWIIQNGVKKN